MLDPDETLVVTLDGASTKVGSVSVNKIAAEAATTITITDTDTVTVSVAAVVQTVDEGTPAEFTVTLTGATSTAEVVISYTLGGTAAAGTDYTAPATPATLTIAAGDSTGTISIPTVDDSVLDPGETLTVTLDGASTTAGTVTVDSTAASATAMITDTGTVTVSVAAVAETVPEGTAAQFTVTLSGAVGSDVALGWSTTGGTATAGADYTAVTGGTVTFVSGESLTRTISVMTLEDILAESDETFMVTLAAPGTGLPTGVSLDTATATGTIEDDDPIKASVAAVAGTVDEGTAAEFTVSLTGGTSAADVEVTYTVGGTATAGTDYTVPPTPATLTIAAGESTGTISIQTLDDGVLDHGETLTVTLDGASTTAGTVTVDSTAASATAMITDAGTVTVSVFRGERGRGRSGRVHGAPCPVWWGATWRSAGAPPTAPRPLRTTPPLPPAP